MQPIVPFMVPGSHIFWGPEWFGSFWCCMSCGGSEQHGGGTKGLCCALLGSARRGSDRACAECLVQPSGSRCLGKFGSESHPINLCQSWCWFRRACLVKMAQTWWSMMINDDHDGSSEVTKRQKESWRSSQTRPSTDVACCLSRLRCLPVELLGAVGMAGIETLKQAPSGLWRFCPQILLMLEWMLLVIVIIVIVLCTFPSQVRSMDAKSLLRMLLVQYCSSLANSCSYVSLFQFAWSLPPRCQEFRFKDYEH